MISSYLTPCPGCRALLPDADGPTHRYIDSSPGCWAIYTALSGGGEPPMIPAPSNALIVDAYAAQHPGTPSPQSVQSVAVHLITIYGVLEKGVPFDRALWMRQEALSERRGPKKNRFTWLTPPDFTGSITIAHIAHAPTADARTAKAKAYVENVWQLWSKDHKGIVASWYELHIQHK